jgi:hypothetical protein
MKIAANPKNASALFLTGFDPVGRFRTDIVGLGLLEPTPFSFVLLYTSGENVGSVGFGE